MSTLRGALMNRVVTLMAAALVVGSVAGRCVGDVIYEGHNGGVWAAAWLPDGRSAVSAGEDGQVHVWSTKDGRRIRAFPAHTETIRDVAVSADGRWVATASWDQSIRVFEVQTGRRIHLLRVGRVADSVAFSPDGRYIVAGGFNHVSKVFDLQTGREVEAYGQRLDGGYAVGFSPNGAYFVIAGGDTEILLWNTRTFQVERRLTDGIVKANAVAFSPDGSHLLTAHPKGPGDGENILRYWDLNSSQVVHRLTGHRDNVQGAAIAADGVTAASTARSGEVWLWDLTTGRQTRKLDGHRNDVRSAAFSPVEPRLLTASIDGTARVWDLAAEKTVVVRSGHTPLETGPAAPLAPPPPAPAAETSPPPTTTTAKKADSTPVSAALRGPAPHPITPDRVTDQPVEPRRLQSTIRGLYVAEIPDGDWVGVAGDIILTIQTGTSSIAAMARFERGAGKEMQTSLSEAVRAVALRYPQWKMAGASMSFQDKYNEQDGGSAGAAFAILLLSVLDGFEIDPAVAITGDVAVNWKVLAVGAVTAKVRGGILDGSTIILIPAENRAAVEDLVVMDGVESLWRANVISVGRIEEAIELARTDRTETLAAGLKRFDEAVVLLQRDGKAALTKPELAEHLRAVLEAIPTHESARLLRDWSAGTRPLRLTLSASLFEIMRAAGPVHPLLRQSPTDSSLLLPTQEMLRDMLGDLRVVRNKLHPEADPLAREVTALADAIEDLRTSASRNAERASVEAVKRRRAALLETLRRLATDREMFERILREGT